MPVGRRSTQREVHVGAAGDEAQAAFGQRLGEHGAVLHDLPLQLVELLALGDAQAHGLGGDDVHERAALHAGEDGPVDRLGVLGAAHDDAGARAGERLVRGAGDDVAVRHRVGVHAGGDEPGDVGDVGHEQRPALVGDRAEGGEVDGARVGAVAADDELGPVLQRERAHLVVVDGLGVGAHVVRDHVVRAPRVVDAHAVREMAAVGELHGQHRVARLEQREQAARLADEPECGCTLACSAPKTSLQRSMASCSTWSTTSQPP